MQFIDLGAQRERIRDKLKAAIDNVVDDGRYIHGPQVAEFEKALANYVGVRHVVACANGTDALLLPLMAYGIGPGDAVFCPSFTFAATAEVVALRQAEPVFVEIDSDTYNIDPASLEAAIEMVKAEGRLTPRAIIPVDLFGLSADYSAITAIAERHGLAVIEDAAQAIGGKFGNGMCGSFGQVGSTSFYPAKPLGCYGDGGAMFTNDDEMADKLRSLAFHGKGETQYDNIHVGINSRLDTLQAADRGWDRNPFKLFGAMLAAEIVMMAMGFAWLAGIIGASASWQFGVAPFILPDLIKVALAAAIVPAVWALFARR